MNAPGTTTVTVKNGDNNQWSAGSESLKPINFTLNIFVLHISHPSFGPCLEGTHKTAALRQRLVETSSAQ